MEPASTPSLPSPCPTTPSSVQRPRVCLDVLSPAQPALLPVLPAIPGASSSLTEEQCRGPVLSSLFFPLPRTQRKFYNTFLKAQICSPPAFLSHPNTPHPHPGCQGSRPAKTPSPSPGVCPAEAAHLPAGSRQPHWLQPPWRREGETMENNLFSSCISLFR